MEHLELLRKAVHALRREGEFPLWLLSKVDQVLEHPERHAGKAPLFERLVSELNDYDPYAGAGCFGGGTSAAAIQATLRELLQN